MALDREKFLKVLALFSSSETGEVAAAARAAHRMLTEQGLTWAQVISPTPFYGPGNPGAGPSRPGATGARAYDPFYSSGPAYTRSAGGRGFWTDQNPNFYSSKDFGDALNQMAEELRKRTREAFKEAQKETEGKKPYAGWTHHDASGMWRDDDKAASFEDEDHVERDPHDPRWYKAEHGAQWEQTGQETRTQWDKAPPSGEAHLDPDDVLAQQQANELLNRNETLPRAQNWYLFAKAMPERASWLWAHRADTTFTSGIFEQALAHGYLTDGFTKLLDRLRARAGRL